MGKNVHPFITIYSFWVRNGQSILYNRLTRRVLQLSIQEKDEEKQHHLHELFLKLTNDSGRQYAVPDPLDFAGIKNHQEP